MPSQKKLKQTTNVAEDTQLQLLYGDDAQFKYWESHLFNDLYLKKDLSEKHSDKWNDTESEGFRQFSKGLRDLAEELKDSTAHKNWSETDTINNCVKHVLNALGWADKCSGIQNPFIEETSFRYLGKTYRTDILLVDHPREKQSVVKSEGDDRLVEARQCVILPVEVKYWQRLEQFRQGAREDKRRSDKEQDESHRICTPNEQTVEYMNLLKKEWSVLTDGSVWRLFNSELSSEDPNRYYEFNLNSLIHSINSEETEADRLEILEASKYFYHFFSKEALYDSSNGDESFVGEVLRYSKKYVNKVEEDLKSRFVKAMNIACNSLYKSAKRNGESQDKNTIRNVAESTLFNLLFIKSLESRGVLPIASTDYKKISLSNVIDKIERFDPDRDDFLNVRDLDKAFRKGNGNSFSYDPKNFELHDRILRLNMIIHDGSSKKDDFGFEISGFRESVFSDEEWNLFQKCKIQNHDWVRILFQLGYAESESLNRKYQQIPYSYFTPRQLGSIYESFLEFKLDQADCDMVYESKQWQKADLESSKYRKLDVPKVRDGELFFTPNNKERKSTGSYYTPDYIVNSIIVDTIKPLLTKKKSTEILDLKICDPAMGSGHFLVGVLNYLTRSYISALDLEAEGDLKISLNDAKREILSSCIYGADLNPRAVKLAKMSLWLESASINKKLEHLDDQLKSGNSLKDDFNWQKHFPKVYNRKHVGFDAVVANPPYVGEADNANIFRELSNSKINQYHIGKMDYWYFFVHLSMDLLKMDGRLGLIATDYWMTNSGASKLRSHLSKFRIDKYISFKDFKVFSEAKGQHNMIMIVTKDDHSESHGKGFVLQNSNKLKEEEVKDSLASMALFKECRIEYSQDQFMLEDGSGVNGDLIKAMNASPLRLSDIAEISQGFTPNPDKVNSRNIKKLPKSTTANGSISVGDGVFVVTSKELTSLGLSKAEKSLAKPYIEAKDLKNGATAKWSGEKYLLYLTEDTCPDISKCPNLKDHLTKFKPIMDERRETKQGRRPWFNLHWPKDESFFINPGIVSVRMTKEPNFSWNAGGNYFDLAVNVVRAKISSHNKALFYYLTSDLVKSWFMKHGSFKGSQLQMDGKPLEKIPVPDFSSFKGSLTDKEAVIRFCESYFLTSEKKKVS